MDAAAPAPADEELVTTALRDAETGGGGAFAELIERHKRRIFALAARFARHDADLQDLCQDIFVAAYRNLGKFRAEAPFGHWLARIATRKCYDYLRVRRRHDEHTTALDKIDFALPDPAPDTEASASQASEIIHLALAKLPAEDRLVLTLLELEDKTIATIADLTGWSQANVKVRAFRARAKLKTILERMMN